MKTMGIAILTLLLIGLGPSTVGQTLLDVPLPRGLPLGFEGPTFSDTNNVAVATPGQIHTWSMLSSNPTYSQVRLAPSLVMSSPWRSLGSHVALYAAVGADLLAETADDELVLVRGLPGYPQVVPTGIFGLPPDFVAVNDHMAVRPVSQGWHVLNHAAGRTSLSWMPSPETLAVGGRYHWGPADRDVLMGLGAGADTQVGTSDDHLILLRGLESLEASSLTVDVELLPPVPGAEGFTVTSSGLGAIWRPLSLPSFEVVIASVAAWGVDYWPMIVTTPAWSVLPPYPPGYGVDPTPGGGLDVWNTDDLGPGVGHVLIARLAFVPEVVGSFYEDWNSGDFTHIVNQTDVAHSSGMWASGFTYVRYGGSSPQSIVSTEPSQWNDLSFVRPNERSLAGFGHVYHWPSHQEATLTLVLDAFRASAVQTVTTQGAWVGTTNPGGYVFPRVFALGAGRVAGFLDSTGSFSATPPDTLRIMTVPTSSIEAPAHPYGPSTALELSLEPGVPLLTSGVTVGLASPYGSDAALVFSLDRGPGVPLSSPYSGTLHLELGSVLAVLPVTLTEGSAEMTFSGGIIPPYLQGTTIYLQGVVASGAWYYLSDLGLIVLG